MEIQLLNDTKHKKALTISKSYRKYKEDQLILIWNVSVSKRIYTLERVVGPVTKLEHWHDILPYRVKVPHSVRSHTPFTPTIIGKNGLKESKSYIVSNAPQHYLCVDSPGTIDREDGVWYKSPDSMGVFVVDIPSQFNWNHNSKPCVHFLSDMWNQQHSKVNTTRTFYLPNYRLPLLHHDSYKCVQTINQNLPILCYDIIQKKTFSTQIQEHHTVTLLTTDDTPDSYPSWFRDSQMNQWSVATANETLNSQWHSSLSIPKQCMLCMKHHPSYSNYIPISSPIRNLYDLWNQCIWWDSQRNSIKWSLIYSNTVQTMMQQAMIDQCKSGYIRHQTSATRFTEYIMNTHTTTFTGTIQYISNETGDGFILLDSPNLQIWCSKKIMKHHTIGDTIVVKCSIRKTPDPFRMIRVKAVESKSAASVSSTEDREMELKS